MEYQKCRLKVIIFFLITHLSFSQTQKTLKQLLWDSIEPCHVAITEDYENLEDAKKKDDAKLIDDTGNGYLEVSGTFPTCGCSCKITSAAYKGNDGKYTILTKEEWPCNWHEKITSNKELSSILPSNFGISSFIPKYESVKDSNKYAIFYLDFKTPRVGTDSEVSLRLIPNGIYNKSASILTTEYHEYGNSESLEYLYHLHDIAKKIKSNHILKLVVDKKYDQIPTSELEILKKVIAESNKYGSSSVESLEDLSKQLVKAYQKFQFYQLIEYKTIVLGWDKKNSKFYIKEKIPNRTSIINFKEFLTTKLNWWSATC